MSGSQSILVVLQHHAPLARNVKLRFAYAPGMPGTFSPPPRVGDPDVHHGTYVTHVPWFMPGLLTSGFVLSRWLGNRSRHSWRMRNPQFYLFGKRPMPPPLTPHPDGMCFTWMLKRLCRQRAISLYCISTSREQLHARKVLYIHTMRSHSCQYSP